MAKYWQPRGIRDTKSLLGTDLMPLLQRKAGHEPSESGAGNFDKISKAQELGLCWVSLIHLRTATRMYKETPGPPHSERHRTSGYHLLAFQRHAQRYSPKCFVTRTKEKLHSLTYHSLSRVTYTGIHAKWGALPFCYSGQRRTGCVQETSPYHSYPAGFLLLERGPRKR